MAWLDPQVQFQLAIDPIYALDGAFAIEEPDLPERASSHEVDLEFVRVALDRFKRVWDWYAARRVWVRDCVADVILILIGLVLGRGAPECKASQALNLTVVLHMAV